jgi:hypothetical protein
MSLAAQQMMAVVDIQTDAVLENVLRSVSGDCQPSWVAWKRYKSMAILSRHSGDVKWRT